MATAAAASGAPASLWSLEARRAPASSLTRAMSWARASARARMFLSAKPPGSGRSWSPFFVKFHHMAVLGNSSVRISGFGWAGYLVCDFGLPLLWPGRCSIKGRPPSKCLYRYPFYPLSKEPCSVEGVGLRQFWLVEKSLGVSSHCPPTALDYQAGRYQPTRLRWLTDLALSRIRKHSNKGACLIIAEIT